MSVLTCPVCSGNMREISRNGVLVDVCQQCRGVWLDRGELEKLSALITEPARLETASASPGPRGYHQTPYGRDWDDDDDDRRRYGSDHGRSQGYGYQHGPKQKSKMSRLLDFFD